MTSPTQAGLAARSITAFLWGSGGAFLRLFMQISVQIVLARLLGPAQYGLFAMSVVVMTFSAFFSDIGLAYGLIQRKHLDSTDIRFVFTLQVLLGLIITVALAALSGPLAGFFREPRLQAIILALAPLALLQAISAVSLNLLKRELDFKALQIAQTVAYFFAYVCLGIPLGLAGAGVWTLVVAWAAQSLLSLLLMYRVVRHPLAPLLRHPDAFSMGHFGGTVLLTNLINWIIGNIDRTVIARTLDSTSVGLYANAYNLVNAPSGSILGVMQPVLFSACAKVQHEPQRIRKAYLTLMAGITLAIMPVFFAISAVASTLVLALYGQRWAPAAAVLQPIALAMPMALLWGITTPVLWNTGRATLEFKVQLPLAGLWVVGALWAAQHSLATMAWTVLGLICLRTLLFTVLATRQIDVSLGECARAMRGGVILSVLTALAAWAADRVLVASALGMPARLAIIIITCGFSVMLALRSFSGLLGPDLSGLLASAIGRLPGRGRRVVSWLLAPQLQRVRGG
ncbi:lipopolysaccharide biosynthesis protein [Achromobacter sp.]|uniref:lipopolysaccharide biosynthesis protein n=1 Tax=Achromobacter sp. TaxID=134375 RepID=UPI002F92C843